jgi:hypothetical protein
MAISSNPVAVFHALALVFSNLPKINPPRAIYAILRADSGVALTIPTSWGEISHRYDTQVADYPIEQGAFALYNKVRRPSTIEVTMLKDGSDAARFAWLSAIRQQEADNRLQLYTIISPQGVYVGYTLTRVGYQTRQDRGANLLYLELQFTEVIEIASSDGLGANVLDPKSGPMADIGRLYSSTLGTAREAVAGSRRFFGG